MQCRLSTQVLFLCWAPLKAENWFCTSLGFWDTSGVFWRKVPCKSSLGGLMAWMTASGSTLQRNSCSLLSQADGSQWGFSPTASGNLWAIPDPVCPSSCESFCQKSVTCLQEMACKKLVFYFGSGFLLPGLAGLGSARECCGEILPVPGKAYASYIILQQPL